MVGTYYESPAPGADAFVKVAEETSLILDIGAWVLHEACRQTREWQRTLHKAGYVGLDWPAGHDARIRDYLAHKPKGKHGEHRYSYAEVGLDEDHVRATFAAYVDHYGITRE